MILELVHVFCPLYPNMSMKPSHTNMYNYNIIHIHYYTNDVLFNAHVLITCIHCID